MKMTKTVIAVLFLMTALIAGCVDKTPLTDEQKVYAGKWVINDGTWLQIYNDGGANFESGSKSVSGGASTFSNNTIHIELMGIGNTFKIDKAPAENEGRWEMTLDGSVYVKQ